MAASGTGQTVLVLGGGIGGVATANRLRRRLDTRHRVVLVNREPEFSFAASYLWVMTGKRRPEQVTRPLHRLRRRGIEVVIGDVQHIDAATRTVTVAGKDLTADHLVIALGTDWATDRVPGLAENGHTFATLPGAEKLGGELGRIESGQITVVTAAPLYKCPAAPYEAALLLLASDPTTRPMRPARRSGGGWRWSVTGSRLSSRNSPRRREPSSQFWRTAQPATVSSATNSQSIESQRGGGVLRCFVRSSEAFSRWCDR